MFNVSREEQILYNIQFLSFDIILSKYPLPLTHEDWPLTNHFDSSTPAQYHVHPQEIIVSLSLSISTMELQYPFHNNRLLFV